MRLDFIEKRQIHGVRIDVRLFFSFCYYTMIVTILFARHNQETRQLMNVSIEDVQLFVDFHKIDIQYAKNSLYE
jgi:hypothetical protein